ncbi:MAG: pyridoxamine 5'-phosphate oxidase family protein [bacterium]
MEKTDVEKIVNIMKETSLHAYLATVDGNQPRVRSVSPIIEDDLSIWITTYSGSRKVKQIGDNPKVCLAFVSQPNSDKSAVVINEAKVIDDSEI